MQEQARKLKKAVKIYSKRLKTAEGDSNIRCCLSVVDVTVLIVVL